jgi:hypothetical protein
MGLARLLDLSYYAISKIMHAYGSTLLLYLSFKCPERDGLSIAELALENKKKK